VSNVNHEDGSIMKQIGAWCVANFSLFSYKDEMHLVFIFNKAEQVIFSI
jgi:hypothetical protein